MEKTDSTDLQMLQEYLEAFNQQLEMYSHQLEMLEQRRIEAVGAVETLEALSGKENSAVLMQVGAGVSLRARLENPEKILLNIGSDIIAERNSEEGIAFLKDRIAEIGSVEKKVGESMQQLQKQAQDVAQRINSSGAQASPDKA